MSINARSNSDEIKGQTPIFPMRKTAIENRCLSLFLFNAQSVFLYPYRPFIRIVAAITLIAFLFTSIPTDFVLLRPLGFVGQAQAGPEHSRRTGTPSGLTGVCPDRAVLRPFDKNSGSSRALAEGRPAQDGPGLFNELNVNTFTLPEYLGHIKDSWQPLNRQTGKPANRQTTVIHIQDAHCNYYAQHKIAEIVEYLNGRYGIDTINLEGGARNYDLSPFTDIPDKPMRERASDYFVKEGLVNGAEYFAINNPGKIALWGVEEARLYVDNLNVYRNSLKNKAEIEKDLKALSHILSNLKLKIYSKELLELDSKYSQYKSETIDFKDYLKYLINISKKLTNASSGEDTKTGTVPRPLSPTRSGLPLFLLGQVLELETSIDFKKANTERDALIDKLQKKLSKNSLEELVLKTVEFKAERLSQKDFYSYLTSKAKSVKIDISDLPEFKKYIVYVSMYDAIDKAKIMEETEALENSLKDSMYENDRQRTLSLLSKNLTLIRNIFNISLTKDDYKYYKDNEDSFEMRNFVSFIAKEASLVPSLRGRDLSAEALAEAEAAEAISNSSLDRYREDIAKFYEYSLKRDRVFVKNIRFDDSLPVSQLAGLPVSRFIHKNRPTGQLANRQTIIITGGFHSENLAELFRRNSISYISIMPNFKNGDYECPYFKILSGEKNLRIKEALPSVLKMALMPPSQLNPEIERAMELAIPAPSLAITAPTPEAPAEEVAPTAPTTAPEPAPPAIRPYTSILVGLTFMLISLISGAANSFLLDSPRFIELLGLPNNAAVTALMVASMAIAAYGGIAGALVALQGKAAYRLPAVDNTGRVVTPEDSFEKVRSKFGIFLAGQVWLHEVAHRIFGREEAIPYMVNLIAAPIAATLVPIIGLVMLLSRLPFDALAALIGSRKTAVGLEPDREELEIRYIIAMVYASGEAVLQKKEGAKILKAGQRSDALKMLISERPITYISGRTFGEIADIYLGLRGKFEMDPKRMQRRYLRFVAVRTKLKEDFKQVIKDETNLKERERLQERYNKYFEGPYCVFQRLGRHPEKIDSLKEISATVLAPTPQPPAGLCVAADTLLAIKDGRQIPIVDVRPGDYVMSLNESTRKIEPHRVIGLLDMGIKPVYKLTIASGASIKTTANHPYLTREGWAKVSSLKAGEEIAVPNEGNTNLLSIRLEGKSLVSSIKRDSETIEDIFLPKQVEISTQMSGKTNAGAKGNMSDFNGQPVRIEFPLIPCIGKDNPILHSIWLNSSGPGTGKYKGIDFGYFLCAFSNASSPVNISPQHITILWCGYSFTNLSKLFFTNVSLSNVFMFIFTLPLSSLLYHAPSEMSRLFALAAWAEGPYLTRESWVKVGGLKAGEEIAVPVDKLMGMRAQMFPRKPLHDPQAYKREIPKAFVRSNVLQRFDLPGFQPQGDKLLFGSGKLYPDRLQLIGKLCYIMSIPEPAFFFKGPEFWNLIFHRFLPPSENLAFGFRHCPSGNYFNPPLSQILKYYSKITSGACLPEGDISFKSGLEDMRLAVKTGFLNLVGLNTMPCHVAYGSRIPGNFSNPQDPASVSKSNISGNTKDVKSFLKNVIFEDTAWACPELLPRDGDIFWDKIASIEYVGREHVYDIEVEGTHNFIGNNIFAHNTAITHTASPLPTPKPPAGGGIAAKILPFAIALLGGAAISRAAEPGQAPQLAQGLADSAIYAASQTPWGWIAGGALALTAVIIFAIWKFNPDIIKYRLPGLFNKKSAAIYRIRQALFNSDGKDLFFNAQNDSAPHKARFLEISKEADPAVTADSGLTKLFGELFEFKAEADKELNPAALKDSGIGDKISKVCGRINDRLIKEGFNVFLIEDSDENVFHFDVYEVTGQEKLGGGSSCRAVYGRLIYSTHPARDVLEASAPTPLGAYPLFKSDFIYLFSESIGRHFNRILRVVRGAEGDAAKGLLETAYCRILHDAYAGLNMKTLTTVLNYDLFLHELRHYIDDHRTVWLSRDDLKFDIRGYLEALILGTSPRAVLGEIIIGYNNRRKASPGSPSTAMFYFMASGMIFRLGLSDSYNLNNERDCGELLWDLAQKDASIDMKIREATIDIYARLSRDLNIKDDRINAGELGLLIEKYKAHIKRFVPDVDGLIERANNRIASQGMAPLKSPDIIKTALERLDMVSGLNHDIINYIQGAPNVLGVRHLLPEEGPLNELMNILKKLPSGHQPIDKITDAASVIERCASVKEELAVWNERNSKEKIIHDIDLLLKTKQNEFVEQNLLEGFVGHIKKLLDSLIKAVEGERYIPRRDKVNINNLLKELTHSLKVTLKKDLCENGYVIGDEFLMRRVLINILHNAMDAMSTQEEKELTVSTRLAGGVIEIRITNNGPRIAEKALPHIFEPYFTTKPNGTGLGLFNTKKIIVEDLGGRIKVESPATAAGLIGNGKGAAFIIGLPAYNAENIAGAKTIVPPAAQNPEPVEGPQPIQPLQHKNRVKWDGRLPKDRFGSDVNIVTVLQLVLKEHLRYLPLISINGSLSYAFKENGEPDWDAIKDFDIRIYAGDDFANRKWEITEDFFRRLNSSGVRIGESVEPYSATKRYTRIIDKSGNEYPVRMYDQHEDELFLPITLGRYCWTDLFFGDTSVLDQALNEAGPEKIIETNVTVYEYQLNDIKARKDKEIGEAEKLKLLKRMYALACMRAMEERFRWLLDEYKALENNFDDGRFRQSCETGLKALDVGEETIRTELRVVIPQAGAGKAAVMAEIDKAEAEGRGTIGVVNDMMPGSPPLSIPIEEARDLAENYQLLIGNDGMRHFVGGGVMREREFSGHMACLEYILFIIDRKGTFPELKDSKEKDRVRKYFGGRRVLNVGLESREIVDYVIDRDLNMEQLYELITAVGTKTRLAKHNIVTELASKDIDVVGLDPQVPEDNQDKRYVHGVVQNMPFDDNSFDDLISAGLFDTTYILQLVHFAGIDEAEFYKSSIHEMKRVLKPGGRLYLDTGPYNSDFMKELERTGFELVYLDESKKVRWHGELSPLYGNCVLVNSGKGKIALDAAPSADSGTLKAEEEFRGPEGSGLGAEFGGDLRFMDLLLKHAKRFYRLKNGREAAKASTPREMVISFLDHVRSLTKKKDTKGAELKKMDENRISTMLESLPPEHRPDENVRVYTISLPLDKHGDRFMEDVVNREGGVAAINFWTPSQEHALGKEPGHWTIIILKDESVSEEGMASTLRHELRECRFREDNLNRSWVEAHNKACLIENRPWAMVNKETASRFVSGRQEVEGVKLDYDVSTILARCLRYFESSVRSAKEGLKYLSGDGMAKRNKLISKEKEKLRWIKKNIKRFREAMGDETVENFIRAVRECGARKELTDLQKNALEAVADMAKSNTLLNFNPDEIIFIPDSTWLYDLFGLHGISGLYADISDSRGSSRNLIVVNDKIKDPLSLARTVTHEIIHKNSKKGGREIRKNHRDEARIFNILEEGLTERLTTALIMNSPRMRHHLLQATGQQSLFGEIFDLPEMKYGFVGSYGGERRFLSSLIARLSAKYGQSEEAGEALVANCLASGDLSVLRQCLGDAWPHLIELANLSSIKATEDKAVENLGLRILIRTMRADRPKETALAGLEMIKTFNALTVYGEPGDWGNPRYDSLKFRAALVLFTVLAESIDKGVINSVNRDELLEKLKKVIERRVKTLGKPVHFSYSGGAEAEARDRYQSYLLDSGAVGTELGKPAVAAAPDAGTVVGPAEAPRVRTMEELLKEYPEFDTNGMRKTREACVSDAERERMRDILDYIASVYDAAGKIAGDIKDRGEAKTFAIPVTESICPIPDVVLKKLNYDIRKRIIDELNRKFGISGINIVFYDGTLAEAERVSAGLNKGNCLVYIEKSELEKTAAPRVIALKNRATLFSLVLPDSIKEDEVKGAYLSIGAHVILGLSVLNAVSDGGAAPEFMQKIALLMSAMSREAVTADEVQQMLTRDDFKMKLPPLRKIDIDKNMSELFLVEQAAMTAL